jgi:hypothetical protein
VESQIARDGEGGLPRRREPDLAGLATFTLDPEGRVTSWSVTATRLFGHPAAAMAGRDVCDVLLTGPGRSGPRPWPAGIWVKDGSPSAVSRWPGWEAARW